MSEEIKSVKYFTQVMDSIVRPISPTRHHLSQEAKNNPALLREHADKVEAYNAAKASFKIQSAEYHEAQNNIRNEFKIWALEQCGINRHQHSDKAWAMAWDRGHDSGLASVLGELEDLSDLMEI